MEKKIIFALLLSGRSCAQSKGEPELAHPFGSIKPHGNVWAPSSARELCAQQTVGARAALSAQQPKKPPRCQTLPPPSTGSVQLSISSSAFWPFPTETAQSCPGSSSRRHSPTCNQEPNHCFSSSKDALPHITAVGTGRGAQCCVPLLHHLTARFNECLCWSALIAVILQGLEVVPLTFYLQTAPSFPRVIRG